jgi:hypothetical protein
MNYAITTFAIHSITFKLWKYVELQMVKVLVVSLIAKHLFIYNEKPLIPCEQQNPPF